MITTPPAIATLSRLRRRQAICPSERPSIALPGCGASAGVVDRRWNLDRRPTRWGRATMTTAGPFPGGRAADAQAATEVARQAEPGPAASATDRLSHASSADPRRAGQIRPRATKALDGGCAAIVGNTHPPGAVVKRVEVPCLARDATVTSHRAKRKLPASGTARGQSRNRSYTAHRPRYARAIRRPAGPRRRGPA